MRGELKDWQNNAKKLGLPSLVSDANLWMDSTDLPLQKKREYGGRKGDFFSFKLQGPGQRFMVMADGKGIIRELWHVVPTKTYDGNWIADHEKELDANYAGAVVLVDNHFSRAKTVLKKVKYYTNYALRKSAPPRNKGGPSPEDTVTNITKERKIYNAAHSHGRSKIEQPFRWMKKKFVSLAEKWDELPEQQVYLVNIAANIVRST